MRFDTFGIAVRSAGGNEVFDFFCKAPGLVYFEEKLYAAVKVPFRNRPIFGNAALPYGMEKFMLVELLAVFIVIAVKEPVNRDIKAVGRIHQLCKTLKFRSVDLLGSVPSVWIVRDADLPSQEVILVPIREAKRGNDALADALAEQMHGLIIFKHVVARKSRAGGFPLQAQICAVVPSDIIKADLQGDRNADSFHSFSFLIFFCAYAHILSIARSGEKVKP